MQKLFIHIGFEKTGTTYLQRCFEQHSDWLASNNFIYPWGENQRYYLQQHVPLACYWMGVTRNWLPREKQPDEGTWQQFLEDIAPFPNHNILVSSEALGSKDTKPESILHMAEILQDFEVKIIVYLRPQFDYAISMIQQVRKHGGVEVSPEFWASGTAPMLDYAARLKPFFDAFGKENVTIRQYDQRQFQKGDLFHDFLSTLSLEFEGSLPPQRVNKSISLEEMEALKSVNRYLTSVYSNSDTRFEDHQVRTIIRNWLAQMPKNVTPIFHGIDPALQAKTIEHYAEMNADLMGADFDHILYDDYEFKTVDTEQVLAKLTVLIARQLVKERRERAKGSPRSE
ncbi:hypothetical protein [Aliiroseovarius crassostreae]|uniref:hypothetical protein n=1 Tax=Aliiroseovarius crassostreae TaxID=154981 RepID=UPI0022011210|nr:hypothetical protein [Aliiroseovarius crassostreae]UWQ05820.1 hypothetical protein K3X22_05120 [Aliiroseovarius crassostreae]